MTVRYCGWLFGLEGTPADSVRASGVSLRPMSAQEFERILGHAKDFFAHDQTIWINTLKRFPFVYEKEWSDTALPIGGEDSVGILLSLLSPGEVRTPIQWSKDEQGNGGSSSSSDIVTLFFRVINSHFQTVPLKSVSEAFTVATGKLQSFLFASAYSVMGPVLLDRFVSTKTHPLTTDLADYSGPHIIARAADVAMMMEYLFHEGSTTETLFRLGMSLAWTLGSTPEERRQIIDTVKTTYTLRSKRVHGADVSTKDMKAETLTSILHADRLLRRAIVARLLSNADDPEWKHLFDLARTGALPNTFDQAHWVP